MKKLLALSLTILFTQISLACDCDKDSKKDAKTAAVTNAAPSTGLGNQNPTFDSLKKLEGYWEITTNEKGKETAKASYEVTSGGNAVIEKIFDGTPHEMVSVYATNGTDISMTHYCMLPNQPKMALIKSEPGKMLFKMKGKEGIKSKNEEHMDSVELVWNSNDQLTQTWTSMKDGKPTKEPTVFTWKRVASVTTKK